MTAPTRDYDLSLDPGLYETEDDWIADLGGVNGINLDDDEALRRFAQVARRSLADRPDWWAR